MQEIKLRPLTKSSAVKPTILYTSIKSKTPMYIESYTELIFAMKLDQDIGVKYFESQPMSYEIVLNGKARRYTPDFHIIDSNGESTYAEVKSSQYKATDSDIEKFQLLREGFSKVGISFKVILVDFSSQYAKNLMFLNRYKYADHLLIKSKIHYFKGTILDLLNKCNSDDYLCSLYSCMARGEISYKHNEKISPLMEVSWS